VGYIHKSAADRDLLKAIERVQQGEVFLSPEGVQVIANQYRAKASSALNRMDTSSNRQEEPYFSALTKTVMSEQYNEQTEDETLHEKTSKDVSPEVLSPREKQVLKMIAHGYSYREIGKQLYITLSTVDTYKSRISEKLSISRVANLVAYAIRNDIL
jgi:two-component system response regulator NreC